MSLKNEPVSVEIESCAPSYKQGTEVNHVDLGYWAISRPDADAVLTRTAHEVVVVTE